MDDIRWWMPRTPGGENPPIFQVTVYEETDVYIGFKIGSEEYVLYKEAELNFGQSLFPTWEEARMTMVRRIASDIDYDEARLKKKREKLEAALRLEPPTEDSNA